MISAEKMMDIDGGAEGAPFIGLSHGIRTGWGNEMLRIGPMKMFFDGSLIGKTAAMNAGYVTEPDNIGFYATPEEKITPEEAIRLYTLHSAYASFEEHLKGSIEAGKLADLAVLGADPTTINPAQIADIPVQGTIIGGKWLYGKDQF
jgi:predicted amidohydrolase YtcJ